MNICRRLRQRRIYKCALKKRRRRVKTEILSVIDKMTEEFKENLPYLQNYRAELIPLVHRTCRYLDKLLDLIPGPVDFDPNRWNQDPLVHSICVSAKGAGKLIAASDSLNQFFQSTQANAAIALLTAEKREKTVSGIEKYGDIIRRDVLQKAVFFEELKIMMPADTLEETRRQVRLELLSRLFSQAADKISDLKNWKSELEVEHDKLTAQMAFAKDTNNNKEIDSLHDSIEAKIDEIRAGLDSPEDYLSHLKEVLQKPGLYLSARRILLKLNQLGILLDDSTTEKANAFSLAEFESGSGQKWVSVWITVKRGRGLHGM